MDRQGRKTTVAARAMAERKVLAHLSERVAMRRHSFVWPGMVPMRLRRQWRRRSWPAALPRGFRPGMPGRISLSVTAALNQSALTGSTARVGDQPFRGWQAARQGGRAVRDARHAAGPCGRPVRWVSPTLRGHTATARRVGETHAPLPTLPAPRSSAHALRPDRRQPILRCALGHGRPSTLPQHIDRAVP